MAINENLDEIFENRSKFTQLGSNPINFIELYGLRNVEVLSYEPDPNTYREPYYYNAKVDMLFKKITASKEGQPDVKVWKQITR